jgi:hypothetical protein
MKLFGLLRGSFVVAIGCFTIVGLRALAAEKAFDNHQTFFVSADSTLEECAKKAVEAVIEASQYPQIRVSDFRQSSTTRTRLNSGRGDQYFEFSGTDSDQDKFTGHVYVVGGQTDQEDPLSGKRTPIIACMMPYNIMDGNLSIMNVNGTRIIYE